MKLRSALGVGIFIFALALAGNQDSCDSQQPVSTSGVEKTTATVPVGPDGLTMEQRNVRDRLAMDNKPGSIKHLYIISAYSGQVILYSTVKGKVTSSGKRLSPYTVVGNKNGNDSCSSGFNIKIGDSNYCTPEVLQDDGTYGDSVPYIFWWDVQGRYRQVYVSGGTILMISDQPLPIKSITLNIESDQK